MEEVVTDHWLKCVDILQYQQQQQQWDNQLLLTKENRTKRETDQADIIQD